MNATLPLVLARALAPMAPPQSEVHQIIGADRVKDPIAEMQRQADKLTRQEANLRMLGVML
jgi:hypothetical protein